MRLENEGIANYAWGRILVITGYKQQKRLLEQKIAELPEAEVPRGLVSVRTIDDSPSHQAEFVICDLVRTSGPGFLIENPRLAVMTTHAQGLTILVGQQDILQAKGSTALSSLKDYLKNRNAIIKVEGWNILCNVCFLPGHQGNCQVKVICGICQGEQAGQRCPEIANAAGSSLETFHNIPPFDDVSRAAFSSIKVGKVADSIKKLKLQRKQQREDANANAYALQMRQTTTDYGDYIRARGSAQPVSETIAGPSTKPDHPPREMQLTIQPAAQESVADPQPHFVLPHLSCKPIILNPELCRALYQILVRDSITTIICFYLLKRWLHMRTARHDSLSFDLIDHPDRRCVPRFAVNCSNILFPGCFS